MIKKFTNVDAKGSESAFTERPFGGAGRGGGVFNETADFSTSDEFLKGSTRCDSNGWENVAKEFVAENGSVPNGSTPEIFYGFLPLT